MDQIRILEVGEAHGDRVSVIGEVNGRRVWFQLDRHTAAGHGNSISPQAFEQMTHDLREMAAVEKAKDQVAQAERDLQRSTEASATT